jgi:hypothetical protein
MRVQEVNGAGIQVIREVCPNIKRQKTNDFLRRAKRLVLEAFDPITDEIHLRGRIKRGLRLT